MAKEFSGLLVAVLDVSVSGLWGVGGLLWKTLLTCGRVLSVLRFVWVRGFVGIAVAYIFRLFLVFDNVCVFSYKPCFKLFYKAHSFRISRDLAFCTHCDL